LTVPFLPKKKIMNIALKRYTNQKTALELLKRFIQNQHLTKDSYHHLDGLLAEVNSELKNGMISTEDMVEIHSSFEKEFLENTLHGRGFLKPNGYPGDYLFLDGIYTNHTSSDPKYSVWDEYVQQHTAPTAVRNRKEYFKRLVRSKADMKPNLNILNVVSGSGRELEELYSTLPATTNIKITCVEVDGEAIEFSKELNKKYLDRIDYVHANIFRYRNTNSYDLIWSAGLFDYLNDKAFIMLLKRFKEWQKSKGEIIIGNYNQAYNPSRNYMEILGDWHLIHRTEEELLELARKAGFEERQIQVNRLVDNVILYLHICL